jgi:hypothetical protein
MRPTGRAAGVILAWAGLAALGYLLAGPAGAAVVALVATCAAVVAVRVLGLPVRRPRRSPGTPQPSGGATGGPSGRIPRLEKVEAMVAWAGSRGRDFEYGARRLIRDLATDRLVRRHGVDLATDPAAARAVIGERSWRYIDPSVSFEASESGVDSRTLTELVVMLEDL